MLFQLTITVSEPAEPVMLRVPLTRETVGTTRLSMTSRVGRNDKAHQLYEYILSDKFVTRFREIAESTNSLRERQQKARDWHENAWDEESDLYDRIDARRREVDSQIRTIVRKTMTAQVLPLAARG